MAEDASVSLVSIRKSLSSVVHSFFFQHFTSKSELLSYLMLCVAKMPFIPPVSIVRSVSGLTGKERPNNTSSASAVAKTNALKEDKGGSVKDRLASNLKQLGKKSQPGSNLPTAKGVSGAKRRDGSLPSSQTGSSPVTSSGESLTKRQQHKHAGHSTVKSESQVKPRSKAQEEVRFTLTLTPEAVLLLQRRNSERRQRSAARNPGSGASAPGSAADSRRRRENVSKRQRNGSHSSRITAKNTDPELGDLSSIVKISLLNEHHKYDDVEYEEEDFGVDERVMLKCTEWLRGLENTPVTAGSRLNRSTFPHAHTKCA
uniref:Uncharacterized protein n=1 Tax=Amphilophus citrinellus TaxID=61819 RepID=A0A3Q0SRA6_AMPCI